MYIGRTKIVRIHEQRRYADGDGGAATAAAAAGRGARSKGRTESELT